MGEMRTNLMGCRLLALCNGILFAAAIGGALAAVAVDDAVSVAVGGKVLIDVVANDSEVASIEIARPPGVGSAALRPGNHILYSHPGGAAGTVTFEYTAHDPGGDVDRATVTVTLSDALRLENTTVKMPATPPPSAFSVTDAFPDIGFWRPTSMESPAGDTKQLFISERGGKIYLIPDTGAPNPSKLLFLDISERVLDDGNEQGLKSFALHPDFANNGYFYVCYAYWAGSKTHSDNANLRLARFQVSPSDRMVADPNSELLLIDQQNDGSSSFGNQEIGNGAIHNFAECNFGPDGYLYVGIGDEGLEFDNAQKIDNEIWSGIIRIDVDKRAGNLEPNPHPTGGIPLDGGGLARYSIPADNPFVGATEFNGIPLPDPGAVRSEFWAVGFRNPWQFSFDSLTGELWVGDVGFFIREEVNVVPKGGNGGWNFLEGDHQWSPPPTAATLLDPEWTYTWGIDGEDQGRAVVGGMVYRGTRYSALVGKYIFSDYVTGHIWSLTRSSDGSAPSVERLAGSGDTVGINLDPSTGDLLLLDHGAGKVRRLLSNLAPGGDFPAKLSDTGVFADLSDLAPNPGVVPYEPNLPFWSDHAIKSRFFVVKDSGDQFSYSRDGAWGIPAGAVWVKHFELETRRGEPSTSKRIETRLIVRNATGAYGVSYRWNDEGTEALLVADAGESFPLLIDDGGNPLTQTWQIPSRSQCLACHVPQTNHVLSFDTRQLNRPGQLGAEHGNFLSLLRDSGYLAGFGGETPNTLPRHVRAGEIEYSLEARARSYLAVNCASCHREGGTAPASWDARSHIPLRQTRLLESVRSGGGAGDHLIVPGDVDRSVIWNRISVANGYTRMPPLATSVIDSGGAALVAEWIQGFALGRQVESYDEWRVRWFGDPRSPEGAAAADPDSDGNDNRLEFLSLRNPLDAADRFAAVSRGDGVSFPSVEDRSVHVEVSPDLRTWQLWDILGNDGIPRTNPIHTLIAPTSHAEQFFRVIIRDVDN